MSRLLKRSYRTCLLLTTGSIPGLFPKIFTITVYFDGFICVTGTYNDAEMNQYFISFFLLYHCFIIYRVHILFLY